MGWGICDVISGFCIEISGRFVWFCICELNDVLYDFTGWFLIHRGKFWDVGQEKSNCGRLHISKMTKSYKHPV